MSFAVYCRLSSGLLLVLNPRGLWEVASVAKVVMQFESIEDAASKAAAMPATQNAFAAECQNPSDELW